MILFNKGGYAIHLTAQSGGDPKIIVGIENPDIAGRRRGLYGIQGVLNYTQVEKLRDELSKWLAREKPPARGTWEGEL